MEAKGVNGQMYLVDDAVRITRKGLIGSMGHMGRGEKEILISQVTSIQFKPASFFTNGYIQLAFMGGREHKGGLLSAAADENTVMFKKGQQASFEALRDELNRRMRAARQPVQAAAPQVDVATQLERLAGLRTQGILTDEEFQAQKARLLAG